jgi:hypothetical protein
MNPEFEDQLYAQVAREMAANNYHPAPMARAAEKAAGNADLARSLYIGFRVEQLARETRRRQLEDQRRAQDEAERRRAQLVTETKRKTTSFVKGILIGILILFVLFMILGLIIAFASK